ncbi:hypothetical protein MATL_G00222860 [Megalops atlanticus]|uniref:Uncharacterized protein n=1 Tax=Megalops atlanticus TaxID=7932 RepID=A0A9D3SWD3_MEGAT|nr:hypothetical protein MATL_G00222860 [Megalops atlanticus]
MNTDSGGHARKSSALSLILTPMKRVQSSPNLYANAGNEAHSSDSDGWRSRSVTDGLRNGEASGSSLAAKGFRSVRPNLQEKKSPTPVPLPPPRRESYHMTPTGMNPPPYSHLQALGDPFGPLLKGTDAGSVIQSERVVQRASYSSTTTSSYSYTSHTSIPPEPADNSTSSLPNGSPTQEPNTPPLKQTPSEGVDTPSAPPPTTSDDEPGPTPTPAPREHTPPSPPAPGKHTASLSIQIAPCSPEPGPATSVPTAEPEQTEPGPVLQRAEPGADAPAPSVQPEQKEPQSEPAISSPEPQQAEPRPEPAAVPSADSKRAEPGDTEKAPPLPPPPAMGGNLFEAPPTHRQASPGPTPPPAPRSPTNRACLSPESHASLESLDFPSARFPKALSPAPYAAASERSSPGPEGRPRQSEAGSPVTVSALSHYSSSTAVLEELQICTLDSPGASATPSPTLSQMSTAPDDTVLTAGTAANVTIPPQEARSCPPPPCLHQPVTYTPPPPPP